MKLFSSPLELCALEVHKNSISEESFIVLYCGSYFTRRAVRVYPPNAVFISIGMVKHEFYTHALIAPDGRFCIGTRACTLKEIP